MKIIIWNEQLVYMDTEKKKTNNTLTTQGVFELFLLDIYYKKTSKS